MKPVTHVKAAAAASPKGDAPKGGARGRLFQNPVLELLSKSSPAMILGLHIPILLSLLAYNVLGRGEGVLLTLGLYAAGVFTWSLAEYFLHRYVFHWVGESKVAQRFHYIAHGFHHDYPRDTEHLFMPPLASIILASMFFGIFFLVMGWNALAFYPGFISGYLAYAYMHYSMHTVPNPPKFLRPLWKHHQLHHHKTPDAAFGVSSMMWDRVFGTMPEAKKPAESL